MEISEYKNIFLNEKEHFFYIANHAIILSLLDKFLNQKKDLTVLDAGCGTGLLSKKLKKYGRVTGLDYSPIALMYAKKRGVKTILGSVVKLPFDSLSFDLVTSVDVLYHKAVINDLAAIKEFYRILKPGGLLVLRVPANKWLHLMHDKHVHTGRRYEKTELYGKLAKTGFLINKLSYINMLLLPLAVVKMLLEKIFDIKPSSEIQKIPSTINNILTKLLISEIAILKVANLPFGLGLIAVCKKPSKY